MGVSGCFNWRSVGAELVNKYIPSEVRGLKTIAQSVQLLTVDRESFN